MTFKKSLLLILVLCSFKSIAQDLRKNEIEIDFGMFHMFFDGTPLLNTNYTSGKNSIQSIFSSSVGITYNRLLKKNHFLSGGFNYYRAEFAKMHHLDINSQVPVCSYRNWYLFNIGYAYNFELGNRIKLRPEIGLVYRYGLEMVITGVSYIGWEGTHSERVDNRDLGGYINLNMQVKINKLLYFHTSFDFSSMLFFGDRHSIDRMKNSYNITKYPTRFDLSWHFGLGFAF